MKLLNDSVIKDRYQVVVVGSGLAGLAAAALLAKRGVEVLLVEHHYLPGGMCTTLRRRGFSFDTGTALMYGFGERGVNPHRFVMNELEEDLDVVEHRALLRMHLEGKTITFWPDVDRFLDELTAAFPQNADELRALYHYLSEIYTKVINRQPMVVPPTEMPPQDNLKMLLRHPIAMVKTVRMLSQSTESVLARYVRDPDLMAFFDKLTSTYCYCTVKETPAILAATMFVDNHVGGAYYPARSPQILASTMEKALEKFGGQTLYRNRVDEILIERGRATGVRLADGTVIRAERVVANVTVWNLYGRLVRPEFSSPKRRAWAEALIPTYPSMVLYLGVDAQAIPAGTNPVEMLIADTRGVNQGDLTLYISSLDDPTIAPAGMHAVTVIAPSTIPWPRPWEPAYRSDEYQLQKRRETDRILDQIETHFPGFRSHIRVIEVGTPATIERYTLKNRGAVGGPKQSIGQEMMKRLHARSDWKNLYLCGDSTVMGMGTPAVTVSGVGAANCVLHDLGLPGYRHRPFARQYVRVTTPAPLAPLPGPTEPITEQGAVRLARECLYCERPGCTAACPARIDIANVMRRIEAGNFAGAARALRETNPLAEVCGYSCLPDPPCQRYCNRREFSERPVRIAGLQAWVCGHAGDAGWAQTKTEPKNLRVAVVGAGPAGLTAAHFLSRLGWTVDLFDRRAGPGGSMRDQGRRAAPEEVVNRDIAGALRTGCAFHPGRTFGDDLRRAELEHTYRAVVVATGRESVVEVERALGTTCVSDPRTGAIVDRPGFFAAGSIVREERSVVGSVGSGRAIVRTIDGWLSP